MKTRSMIGVSAAFWTVVAAATESMPTVAIVIVGHALFFLGHNIEVKLNKLLHYYNLTVTSEDLDR